MVAIAPLLMAQTRTDAKPQVLRAESREVQVDITVTAKKGISTNGLTARAFTVREDGKVQTINSVQSADPETLLKHIVLYFDLYTSPIVPDDQHTLEKAVESLIDSVASPDRYISLMSMTQLDGARVLQDFTASASPLVKAVADRFANWPEFRGRLRHSLGDSLAAVCRSMGHAPGEKTLLVLGGYGSSNQNVDSPTSRAIQACNEANVRVYQVVVPRINHVDGWFDPKFQPHGPLPYPHDEKVITPPHSLLAEQTGGLAFDVMPELKDELATAAREQDHDYRVFYTPPPSKDGACHKLRVSLNVSGFSARARDGYCTEKQHEAVAGKIGREAGGVGTFNVTMQLPYFYVGTDRASVRVAAEFLPAGMKFENDGEGLYGEMDIVGTAFRPDGTTAGRFADTVDVHRENQQDAEAFMETPYHYESQFYVAPGTYVFRLEIGVGPNAVGKVETPLKVEPWKQDSLSMGSLALSTETRPAPEVPDVPALEGQGPLIADRKQFVPAATNIFQKSSQVYFYTEFYDPALSGANPQPIDPSVLKMEYCISEKTTGEVKGCSQVVSLESLVHLGNPVVPFGTHIPVDGLPAGSYRLEVRAVAPASPPPVTRSIDFELK